MKAKKKPIEKLTPADLGVDLAPVLETIKVTEPPKRVGGGKVGVIYFFRADKISTAPQVSSVDELVERLKEGGFAT
jgi:electron transfer flavoprotein beta subunit